MKIIIRLNAEADGKLVYNFQLKEKLADNGVTLEPVRLSNLCHEVMEKLKAGAGDRCRTEKQMPNCPFKIILTLRKIRASRLYAEMNYQTNAHCTSSMLAAGMQVVNHLREHFEIV